MPGPFGQHSPMQPVEIQTAEARFEVHPELGGWLTSYSREVAGKGRIDVLHSDPDAVARHPKDMWAGIPLLFPLVSFNHVPGAEHHYEWQGQRHALPQHGFARRLPWTVLGTSPDAVAMELVDTPSTRAAWPFSFSHRLEYRLDGGRLVARHAVTNRSPGPMPFACGIHPYLRVPLVAGGDRDACRVKIPRAQRLNPIGRWDGFFGEPFPARDLSIAGDYSGTLFLGELAEPELRLVDPAAGVETVLNWSGAPGFRNVALWSRTPREPYFCLEPWTALPNAFTRAEPGELIVLEPGGTWTAHWWLDAVASHGPSVPRPPGR